MTEKRNFTFAREIHKEKKWLHSSKKIYSLGKKDKTGCVDRITIKMICSSKRNQRSKRKCHLIENIKAQPH